MLSSSRFVVAVHVMSMLHHHRSKGPICSSILAESVDTNPVVIRRMMSELESHGLVTSATGRGGGFQLAKPAEAISLANIYAAVEDQQVFRVHKASIESTCPIAMGVMKSLLPKLEAASDAMTRELGETSLRDIVPELAEASAA